MTPEEHDFLFDVNGYQVLDEALSAKQLRWLNAWIEAQPSDLPTGTWLGNVEVHTYGGDDGLNYQNVVEGGPVFEELIDNPAWIGMVRRYVENDYNKVSINECFLNIRGQGGFIGIHSGGHVPAAPMTFRHHTGRWNVGQINVLMALEDIGPGDGATVVVPGSHKAVERHPVLSRSKQETFTSEAPKDVLGAREVHLKAGQALMFTDALVHGGSPRTNPGMRRILIYRYSPHSMLPRYNYIPSEELLARLTPERRAILNPVPPRLAPGRVVKGVEAERRELVLPG